MLLFSDGDDEHHPIRSSPFWMAVMTQTFRMQRPKIAEPAEEAVGNSYGDERRMPAGQMPILMFPPLRWFFCEWLVSYGCVLIACSVPNQPATFAEKLKVTEIVFWSWSKQQKDNDSRRQSIHTRWRQSKILPISFESIKLKVTDEAK